jgi:N-acetyl sugar amidotransferase
MDTTAPDIKFDAQGICNYCSDFLAKYTHAALDATELAAKREQFLASVKRHGQGKRYDCIVGLSGGVDSSYALHLAIQSGLRPLAVHFDNGWDSELAQHNIARLVRQLGVDLHTHVVDWPENRDMQKALIRAGVIDIEMIMDNAQAATNFSEAVRHGLKDILSGTNTRTEGMPMPPGWTHYKFDVRNIRAIQRRFGTMQIKTHPLMSTLGWFYYRHVRGVQWHNFLDLVVYNKAEAVAILQQEYGYVPYRYKHNESVFTRFYQNYLLPKKFGIDKRRVHHSTQICTGQMTRAEAFADLSTNPYIDSGEAASDRKYVLKKLGMSDSELDAYLSAPPVSHARYPSELPLLQFMGRARRALGRRS